MKIFHLHNRWAEPTNPNDVLWRFIGIDKLAALLETSSLYFSRTDQFEDPTEGLVPYQWNRDFHKEFGEFVPPAYPGNRMQSNFACCWYRGDYEPAQLWRLNPNNASGVCIRTTQARLFSALQAAPSPDEKITDLLFGGVKYIDHHIYSSPIPAVPGNAESHSSNLWSHYLKKKAFVHEQEVRILFFYMKYGSCPHPSQPKGIDVKVDLNLLVEKIIVSPYVLPNLVETVRKMLPAYGLNSEVERSSLLDY